MSIFNIETVDSPKRIYWVDMAKGIAIILVILGHMPFDENVISFIYAFHMPLFFIISGFFCMEGMEMSLKKFFKKRFKRLIIPYLIFGILIMIPYGVLLSQLRTGDFSISEFLTRWGIGGVGQFGGLRSDWKFSSTYWFLPCLFSATLIVWLISKYFARYRLTILLAITIIGFLYCRYVHISLPFCFDLAMIASFFLLIGAWYYKYQAKISWSFAIISFLTGVAAWYMNGKIEMYDAYFNNELLFVIAGVGISIFVLKICQKMPLSGIVLWLGVNSLLIYMLHFIFKYPIAAVVVRLPYSESYPAMNIVYNVIGTIIIVMMLIPICNFITRYLPWTIGAKRK